MFMKHPIKRRVLDKNAIVKAAMKSIGKKKLPTQVEFLGSGSTTLNLALSGKGKNGGWARGRVVNVVGDGSSGKTLLALELAFWCLKNIKKIKSQIYSKIKKIQIVYLNAEGVMDFPLDKMYGKDFKKAIEWKSNQSIEAMGRDYINRINNLRKGEFLLYIIDSWDALKSTVDNTRFSKSVKEGKEIEGSFNLEKQKYASSFFSYVCSLTENNKKLEKQKDATLFIVSQVRTKIGVTFGKKTYRAGGKSLDFYTHQVAWVREIAKLRKTKQGENRVYGIKSAIKIERSKVAKPFREAEFTILYDYGLDDLSSMADYLWGKKTIEFMGKEFAHKRLLIKYIERNNLQDEIIKQITEKWQNIELAFEQEVQSRKPRY
jgi:recombination protein RecA